MKKLNELNYKEQDELAELLEAWLSEYTTEVIERVVLLCRHSITSDTLEKTNVDKWHT